MIERVLARELSRRHKPTASGACADQNNWRDTEIVKSEQGYDVWTDGYSVVRLSPSAAQNIRNEAAQPWSDVMEMLNYEQ